MSTETKPTGGASGLTDGLGGTTTAEPVDHTWFSQAALDVTAERRRQIEREGWTPEHDDDHGDNSLAAAAACYALPDHYRDIVSRRDGRDVARSVGETTIVYDQVECPRIWPWHGAAWKPKDRRSDLVRAGALILAEIERLDRLPPNV